MSEVAAQDVWKYYGDYPALREITLGVEPGTCLAMLGRNGAGKTTLLRILAGLSKPTRCQVTVAGKDTRDQETRRRIGVLGHWIAVYDELSAYDNLRLFALGNLSGHRTAHGPDLPFQLPHPRFMGVIGDNLLQGWRCPMTLLGIQPVFLREGSSILARRGVQQPHALRGQAECP